MVGLPFKNLQIIYAQGEPWVIDPKTAIYSSIRKVQLDTTSWNVKDLI